MAEDRHLIKGHKRLLLRKQTHKIIVQALSSDLKLAL